MESAIKSTCISPDSELTVALSEHVAEIDGIEMVRGLSTYPTSENLIRFFEISPARIVFLDIRNPRALEIASEMELRDPGLQFIGVGEPEGSNYSWLGIQERIALPLEVAALKGAITRRLQVLSHLPRRYQRPPSFVSFLPAKGGAGASTLASCLANILAPAHKTLLFDFDLCSGTVGFRYHSQRVHAIGAILDQVADLDENLWSQIVSRCGKLHLVSTKPSPNTRVNEAALGHLFEFLRTVYDVVIFDLSGNLDSYSLQVMRACRRVFLVTTQEVDCLFLGRGKAEELIAAGLGERLGVLVNRVRRGYSVDGKDVQEILHLPKTAELPNDYKSVQDSLGGRTGVGIGTPLAKAVERTLPPLLTGDEAPSAPPKRFIEYVSWGFSRQERQVGMQSERWV